MPKITIKAARVNAGLTQKQAAEQLGIAPQTLSQYEKKGAVKIKIIKKMSEVYKMPMEFFLN